METKALYRPGKSQKSRPVTEPATETATEPKKQPPTYQAIANLTGHLTVADDKLFLSCPDTAKLPIAGIDSRLSLWLMARPGVMFSQDSAEWIVYPKSDRSGSLTLFLKGRIDPDNPKPFKLQPDTAHICGKLLAVEGDRMTIGIRRNLSPHAFRELSTKGMIKGSEFDQFSVNVWGTVDTEVGAIVDVNCKRIGSWLVIQS